MKSLIENQLDALAQEAFESHSWNFFPLFPNILIRLFDFEEAMVGRIIKPGTSQSPNHRAIVIRTWHHKIVTPVKGVDSKDTTAVYVRSELEVGDIITVPYWAGVPTGVEELDDAGYRVVPENKTRDYRTGRVLSHGSTQETPHIFFKQEMVDKEALKKNLAMLIDNFSYTSSVTPDKLVEKILEDYDLVPRKYSLVQPREQVGTVTEV